MEHDGALIPATDTIPIVFDKSHLLTIGERLYTTSLDLVRELVANAYDADATEVLLTITPEEITVSDNGSGMDEQALRQYFTIGSRAKLLAPRSPGFGRERIGEFGIGWTRRAAASTQTSRRPCKPCYHQTNALS